MGRTLFKYCNVLLLSVLCLLGAGLAQAQETVEATAVWNLPAGDWTVDHFIVQHSQDDGPWVTVGTSQLMELTFEVDVDAIHRFRVASVTAEGVQSAYSAASPELIPNGQVLDPPGVPGQPIIF